MKNTLLIIGCGDIALRAAPLLQTHYRILGLCRNLKNSHQLRAQGITPIYGDLDHPSSLDRLAGIAQSVLHLAPPPNHGIGDTRTTHLLSALARRSKTHREILPQRLIYISTSGVYGNCHGALIDETHPAKPGNNRALRRMNAEKQIRRWGIRNHINISILRVPGIYASNRLPLARLHEGHPVLVDADDNYTNHIHADDLAQIIFAALRYAKPGGRIYHACDNSHLKMGEYFDLVADQFDLPRPPRITRDQANQQISPGMLSYMKESRRLKNIRMKQELRITLRFPTVQEGIRADSITS
ncbi:Nucleoside-diphosphate-sugar epimerase [Nitrosomonas cryotolerans]|uniref:Nucleoside-diphosphate-sugar epimerase n=1 Tax=Nitrosomonas cryotolerans ATCC 49181 TaxID=1131553 RepID=A0A1N6FF06_9PROT|nr:SDR family oxidoreductase [Nitrosomonas cryotolerans]SFP63399.1 Nucleoside-diphosphate-sugar epimerase [Nitrosomonas cryotolerans]SIN93842.1 Nucleoside-diphosphate-sugar epimerase [Nitrosomonas cryotolerans ATCC 49181]